jgi:excisionase family DNA binding protein
MSDTGRPREGGPRTARGRLSLGRNADPALPAVLDPGEVRRYLRCSAKHVCDLIDSGRLRGWRLPGPGRQRRVLLSDLVAFMRESGCPAELLDGAAPRALLCGCPAGLAAALQRLQGGWLIQEAPCLFAAALACAGAPALAWVVVGPCVAREAARQAGGAAAALGRRGPRLLALLPEDDPDGGPYLLGGYAAALPAPWLAADVALALRGEGAGR